MIVLAPTKANCRILVEAWSVRGVVVTVTASGTCRRWVSTVRKHPPGDRARADSGRRPGRGEYGAEHRRRGDGPRHGRAHAPRVAPACREPVDRLGRAAGALGARLGTVVRRPEAGPGKEALMLKLGRSACSLALVLSLALPVAASAAVGGVLPDRHLVNVLYVYDHNGSNAPSDLALVAYSNPFEKILGACGTRAGALTELIAINLSGQASEVAGGT